MRRVVDELYGEVGQTCGEQQGGEEYRIRASRENTVSLNCPGLFAKYRQTIPIDVCRFRVVTPISGFCESKKTSPSPNQGTTVKAKQAIKQHTAAVAPVTDNNQINRTIIVADSP